MKSQLTFKDAKRLREALVRYEQRRNEIEVSERNFVEYHMVAVLSKVSPLQTLDRSNVYDEMAKAAKRNADKSRRSANAALKQLRNLITKLITKEAR